jgi:Uma2 family endonuclease
MAETGDPTTLAPEVCVEITSSSNTAGEIQEKRALYLETGAEEVWVIDEEEHIRVYDLEGERERSAIAASVPGRL